MYLLQNAAVGLSAVAAWLALWQEQQQRSSWLFWLWVALLISLGSLSSLGAMGSTISVEKEWTKAMCQGDAEQLSQVNAGKQKKQSFHLLHFAKPQLVSCSDALLYAHFLEVVSSWTQGLSVLDVLQLHRHQASCTTDTS